MIHKFPSAKPGCVRVTFELPSCIWADRIFVVGDFNEWSTTATPLAQERDGVWRVTLDLPQGSRYEYRYLIDGHWKTDCHADGFATNAHGSENSIVCTTLPMPVMVERASSQVWDSRSVSQAAVGTVAYQTKLQYPTLGDLARRVGPVRTKAA